MMRHAWGSYSKYAWGANELSPVAKSSRQGQDSQMLNNYLDSVWTPVSTSHLRSKFAASRLIGNGTCSYRREAEILGGKKRKKRKKVYLSNWTPWN
jgi:hypothetical protein